MAITRSMLSTIDNPYNPFEDWDSWYAFDERKGYHTTSFLARMTFSSDELPEPAAARAISDAIDLIISENILGIYVKISKKI